MNSPMPTVFDLVPERDLTPVASQKVYGSVPDPSIKWHQQPVGAHRNLDIDSAWTKSTWFWIIIVPIVVFLLLIFLTPTFIEISNPGKSNERLNPNSLLLWTLVLTLIVWILFWGFSKCKTC